MNSWQLRCITRLVKARPPTTKICLSVLFQLLDEGDEVAVAADDHVGVDVTVGEGHLERVEREVDVRPVLVTARREVALHQLGRMLGERSAVVPGAGPVAIGDLGHHVATLLERLEDHADVELHPQRALDPDLDVVEVDEYRNLQSCVCQTFLAFLPGLSEAHGHYGSNRNHRVHAAVMGLIAVHGGSGFRGFTAVRFLDPFLNPEPA